jgi:hypothetical protein
MISTLRQHRSTIILKAILKCEENKPYPFAEVQNYKSRLFNFSKYYVLES